MPSIIELLEMLCTKIKKANKKTLASYIVGLVIVIIILTVSNEILRNQAKGSSDIINSSDGTINIYNIDGNYNVTNITTTGTEPDKSNTNQSNPTATVSSSVTQSLDQQHASITQAPVTPNPATPTPKPTPTPTPIPTPTPAPTPAPATPAPKKDLTYISFSSHNFKKNQKFTVYSAPTTASWYTKAKNGGPVYASTNDVIYVAGYVGNWLLIQYETNKGNYRMGYTSQATGSFQNLNFNNYSGTITSSCSLTDGSNSINISSGTSVTVLGKMDAGIYIEAYVNGQQARGTVPESCVNW